MDQLLPNDINQLFRRISEGDEEAFGILFRHSVSALYPFILRMVKQQAAAEEVVQASFLRVWLSRDKLPGVEQPRAWLYKVVANECYTWMRKEAREMKLRAGAGVGEEADDSLSAEIAMPPMDVAASAIACAICCDDSLRSLPAATAPPNTVETDP